MVRILSLLAPLVPFERHVPIVIQPSTDPACGAILLGLLHLLEIQRVLGVVLVLAIPPRMRERKRLWRRHLAESLVDLLVAFFGKSTPAIFAEIKFPGHGGGGGGGGTYPNNMLLENA